MASKKSKSNTKGKQNKTVNAKKESFQEFFYYFLTKMECDASMLAQTVDLPEDKKEIWVSYNCLELILENDSLVLEDAREDFHSEDDKKLLSSMGIKSVYAVTFEERDKETAIHILKGLSEKFEGLLCSDTEDFKPFIIEEGKEYSS